MNKKTFLLLLAVCLLSKSFTQTTPVSTYELEARGTWVFWPYKIETDGTLESTLKFANGSDAARFADSSRYAPIIGSSSSSAPLGTLTAGDLINQDYVKGVLLVFAWNYLQYNEQFKNLVPTYGTGGNDLIRYQDFYQAIKAVVNTDNIKGYGIQIWTGALGAYRKPLAA